MSAYVIFVVNKVNDPAGLAEYRRLGVPSLAGTNAKFLVRPGPMTTLEGPPAEAVVMLEFPTKAEAEEWYNSPLYQEAMKHRLAASECQAYLVEGPKTAPK
jgi:uncharacterized protein (DUF1330 family)